MYQNVKFCSLFKTEKNLTKIDKNKKRQKKLDIFPKLEHIVYCRMLMPQEILLGHKIQGEWAKHRSFDT